MIRAPRLFVFSAFLLQHALTVSAYVTARSAVPAAKQVAWLKQMTGDICGAPPGALTEEMLTSAPELMSAWAKKKPDKECALAVESLVKRVIDERRAGNLGAVATTEDYNRLLGIWARVAGEGSAAAERCEQIVTEMQERYELGDLDVQPTQSSFKTVLIAWRQSGQSYAALRARRQLEMMIRTFQEGKNDQALPDSDCFDIVLQTWSKSGLKDAPEATEKILAAMERLYLATRERKLKPKTSSFNAVLTAWERSGRADASLRALGILGFMEHLAAQGDKSVQPDSKSYNAVVGAIQRSNDRNCGHKASMVLQNMEEAYRSGSMEPDTILFNAAISCWARSNMSGSFRRARSILDNQMRMYEDGCETCKPDVYGFTSVMATAASECGKRKERSKAFDVALSTYQQLRKRSADFGGPSHVTYGTMLKACARLLPAGSPTRLKWTKKTFMQCRRDGCVGDMVLSRLREAATPELYKELMGGHSKKDIPNAWRRNVEEKKYRKKVVDRRLRP